MEQKMHSKCTAPMNKDNENAIETKRSYILVEKCSPKFLYEFGELSLIMLFKNV